MLMWYDTTALNVAILHIGIVSIVAWLNGLLSLQSSMRTCIPSRFSNPSIASEFGLFLSHNHPIEKWTIHHNWISVKKITVFENSKKVSFNIAMFSFWVDKNYFKNAKKDPVWRVFRKAEVLPDRSILIGQRLVQNTKSKKLTLIWKICTGKIREKKKCLRGFFFSNSFRAGKFFGL